MYLVLFYALLRNSMCHLRIRFQRNTFFSVLLGSKEGWKKKFFFLKKSKKKNYTWISWILLNPSLQKNSIKLEMVLGPGISAMVLNDFFWAASFGLITLSGTVSSPAIPNVPLVADLCKQRKAKSTCLLRPSQLRRKFLQHAVVNVCTTDIFNCAAKFESGKNQRFKMPGLGMRRGVV